MNEERLEAALAALDQVRGRLAAADAASVTVQGDALDVAYVRSLEAVEEDAARLIKAVEAVEALHVKCEETGKCKECTVAPYSMHSVHWPCPTVSALTAALGGE